MHLPGRPRRGAALDLVLFALALELGLQGEQLGKGRVRVGLPLARTTLLGRCESPVATAAPTTIVVAPRATMPTTRTTAAILALGTATGARRTTPIVAPTLRARAGTALAFGTRTALEAAVLVATATSACLGGRSGGHFAFRRRALGRGTAPLANAVLVGWATAPMRPAVVAALVMRVAMRVPDLDEHGFGGFGRFGLRSRLADRCLG